MLEIRRSETLPLAARRLGGEIVVGA